MGFRLSALVAALSMVMVVPATPSAAEVGTGGQVPGTSRNFILLGHNPLAGRGMNAAPAINDHFVYIGSRTDGSSRCGVRDPRRDTTGLDSCPHPSPGIQVVDIANPFRPTVVGEFGAEFVTGANLGQTSRERRVWPQQKLLAVMYFRCSTVIHACPQSSDVWRIRFFDLAANPANPPLIATYTPLRSVLGRSAPGQERHPVRSRRPELTQPPNAVRGQPEHQHRAQHRHHAHHAHLCVGPSPR